MRIDWWTLSLQTVNAIVLIWLLAYFFFKPIANVIAARKAAAAQLLEEAEQAKSAALSLREEEKAALADVAARRSAALAAAQTEAEEQRKALLAAARSDADRMRDEARGEMTRQLEFARDAQMKHASALALDIAGRLVERFPQSSLVSGFVGGLAAAAAALPPDAKKDFEEEGGVRLKAPRALTAQEEARLSARARDRRSGDRSPSRLKSTRRLSPGWSSKIVTRRSATACGRISPT